MLDLPASLDLHVTGHLSAADARRQHRSAAEILRRLKDQPGLILGDEVGMGKTFVALAVAAAHAVHDPTRPVVVMVPQAVVRKWLRDADTFRRACLREERERQRFRVKCAYSGVEFLKLLDDPEDRKATLIVLAHTAPTRRLADRWVKLAMLQASIKGRHGVEQLRQRLARFGPMLLRHAKHPDEYADVFLELLKADTNRWQRILVREGWLDEGADDPIPQMFVEALADSDLSEVYERIVQVLPERSSANIGERIRSARAAMDSARDGIFPKIWRSCLGSMKLSLPLLILDEAHRVKNAHTQLASLLKESREDLDRVGGMFANTFERMLFLTATPFQLGHGELHNVLSRFKSVRWKGANAPKMGQEEFARSLEDLLADLDDMQRKTDWLERAWKQLLAPDIEEAVRAHGEFWWETGADGDSGSDTRAGNDRIQLVARAFGDAKTAIRKAESGIKAWVLRHSRPSHLPPPYEAILRRQRVEGAAVRADIVERREDHAVSGGLRIDGAGSLPFFLAARLSTIPDSPSVFAGGIASSFDALLDTQRDDVSPEERPGGEGTVAKRATWYLDQLRAAARTLDAGGYSAHPKLATTVDLAMSLWRRGEKVLIFCYYRQTGGALHRALSEKMLAEIEDSVCRRFGCSAEDVTREIERIAARWDKDSPAARAVVAILDEIMERYPDLFDASASDLSSAEQADGEDDGPLATEQAIRDDIHSIVLRFLRTPTFFLRFAPVEHIEDQETYVRRCFESTDESGLSLRALVEQFLKFLASRPSARNRKEYLDALKTVQTGTHAGPEVSHSFEGDAAADGRVKLMPNVRRVYGDTREETRQRLMLTFNTPFYPEILITSSVMAEGVDLHLNCRHIIHHDLDWNPSTLEQRTGRVDRLGAKTEQCGRSIRVYIPYLEGCQDEKQFRVVMDRERWFGVVMGAEESITRILKASAWEVERIVNQPPIPAAMATALGMSLATVELDGVAASG